MMMGVEVIGGGTGVSVDARVGSNVGMVGEDAGVSVVPEIPQEASRRTTSTNDKLFIIKWILPLSR
jgi:hypothetical protein